MGTALARTCSCVGVSYSGREEHSTPAENSRNSTEEECSTIPERRRPRWHAHRAFPAVHTAPVYVHTHTHTHTHNVRLPWKNSTSRLMLALSPHSAISNDSDKYK